MQRGGSKHGFRAPNFIHDEARARLGEVIKPAQEKLANALQVDRYETLLYIKKMSTSFCSCQHKDILDDELTHDAGNTAVEQLRTLPPVYSEHQRSTDVIIDYGRNPIGDFGAFTEDSRNEDPSDYDLDDDDQTTMLGESPDCAICYRSGFVPGFELFGFQRNVLTTFDIKDMNSAQIERITEGPDVIVNWTPQSFVEFLVPVPKYFQSVRYSVRLHHDILDDKLFVGQDYLTLQTLLNNRGKFVAIRCKAGRFTHIDITFDLGSETLYTNIAQFSKVIDWTKAETLNNISVVWPTRIPEMTPGSYLVLPKKGVMLKTNDTQFLREHNNNNMNWETNCRVLQPQEPVRNIHKGFRLL